MRQGRSAQLGPHRVEADVTSAIGSSASGCTRRIGRREGLEVLAVGGRSFVEPLIGSLCL